MKKKLGHFMEGDMGKPAVPHITTGKPQRADGTKDNTPPSIILFESFNANTGEPERDRKDSGM